MKTGCWMAALVVVAMGVGLAAEPTAKTAADLSKGMRDLERNVALGTALTMRDGLPAEYDEVSQLAEQGLAAAREAVAKQPGSAEAHYLLGSWLLYAYRVVEVRRLTSDPLGGERAETVRTVAMGLSDTPDEGLAELVRATELAPENGQYLLDYAAALVDCEFPADAMGILKRAWTGEPKLSQEQRMQAGLLLSDVYVYQGEAQQAREWVYVALSLDPTTARAVERLRHLDAAQAAEAEAALAEAVAAARAEALGLEEPEAEVGEEEAPEEEPYSEEEWSEPGTEEEYYFGDQWAEPETEEEYYEEEWSAPQPEEEEYYYEDEWSAPQPEEEFGAEEEGEVYYEEQWWEPAPPAELYFGEQWLGPAPPAEPYFSEEWWGPAPPAEFYFSEQWWGPAPPAELYFGEEWWGPAPPAEFFFSQEW